MKINLKNLSEALRGRLEALLEDWQETAEGGRLLRLEPLNTDGRSGIDILVSDTDVTLRYGRPGELFRAFSLLPGLLAEVEEQSVSSAPAEQKTGVDGPLKHYHEAATGQELIYMQDLSRNATATMDSVKKMLRLLATMGYTGMMLYTEDTYELDGYPFFGYQRGRFTKAELKELDAYALGYGIELIPCIQTLAHLGAIFRWDAFGSVHDIDDILLCKSEETYRLLEEMFRTCRECFSSREINIGMDEAGHLGRGDYLKNNPYEPSFNIIMEHLHKVMALAQKYDFRCMMWSDMYFKFLAGSKDYHGVTTPIDESALQLIPEDITLIYWDYYGRDAQAYSHMMREHQKMQRRIAFAGGAWKWSGYAPLLSHSLQIIPLALGSCREHKVETIMVTAWSDDASECADFAVLPVLQSFAEQLYGHTDDAFIKARFKQCVQADFDDFMLLESLNLTPDNLAPGRLATGVAKYLLYQDPMLGIYDRHVDAEHYPAHYADCAARLQEAASRNSRYAYLFDTLAALALLLEEKSVWGLRCKQAYDNADRKALEALAASAPRLAERAANFREALRRQWFIERRAQGFEVLDIRVSGVAARLRSAALRLNDYLAGRLEQLEELEAERLALESAADGSPLRPVRDKDLFWAEIATPAKWS